MAQQFPPQFKSRLALLVFLKGAAAPMVLYFENPKAEYEDFLNAIKTGANVARIIEKEPTGPIKKVAIMSNQIASVALQEEIC